MKIIKEMSKMFLDNISIANSTFTGNMVSNSIATNNICGSSIVLAPVVTALNAMFDHKVSAMLVSSYESPIFYIEISTGNDRTCGILYDVEENTYTYDWDYNNVDIIGNENLGIPISFVPYIPRLLELLYFKDSEFFEYYNIARDTYAKTKKLNSDTIPQICDLLYNQSKLMSFDSINPIYDYDTNDIKWEKIKDLNIIENVSHIMGHTGKFTKLSKTENVANSSTNQIEERFGNFSFNVKVKKAFKNEAFFPKMPKNVVIRPEMVDIARYAYATKDEEQPLNNFTMYGPTGSGKSFICKYLASEKCFGIPYIPIMCSGNKDESLFTGMYQNGPDGNTIFVNSKFAEYVQMPCLIELIESNALDEDVAIALNSFMDHDYGYLITDDLQTIKRHPNCIIISTFNPGYAGTKTPNRSVIRRSDWCTKVDKISELEIKNMFAATSGVKDETILDLVYEVYELVENFISEEEIDGEVSMTEYSMCAKFIALDKKMGIYNPLNVIRNTIINKLVSTIDFDEEISQELALLISRKIGVSL